MAEVPSNRCYLYACCLFAHEQPVKALKSTNHQLMTLCLCVLKKGLCQSQSSSLIDRSGIYQYWTSKKKMLLWQIPDKISAALDQKRKMITSNQSDVTYQND